MVSESTKYLISLDKKVFIEEMQITAIQIRSYILNNYLTLYKIKYNPHDYKSVRNQKRIYSTQS